MNKNIAYIMSGKLGMHRFTYNELLVLEEKGVQFNLCFTQLKNGPFMPKSSWTFYKPNIIKANIQFFYLLFAKRKVVHLFFESLKLNVLPYFVMALSFYKDLKFNNISSIHCQMGDNKLYIGYFLKKLMAKPLTVTVHAHELYQREVYDNNDKIKKLYSNCDKVITISDFNADIIKEKFGVQQSKLEVMRLFPEIYNFNFIKDKVKILIVANWVQKKGFDDLFNAIKQLNRDDFILWVVGGSNLDIDAVDVYELIDKYNIKDKVVVLGTQGYPLISIIYNECDFFCLPSYTDYFADGKPSEREGISVALMEAMAWGKPVITTRHAGNTELLSEILIEERDVEGLVNAIKYLLENPDKWLEMGKKNQQIIKKRYKKSNVDQLITIFKNV